MSVNRALAQRAVSDLLKALGHDPDQLQELSQTPALVVDALERDWLCGYEVDIPGLFAGAFNDSQQSSAIVVVSQIALGSLCPHHLLPSEGTATVAYLPGQVLLGLGTVARLAEAYARRLTLQEQIGHNIVSALVQHGGAKGAYCRLEMRHACLRLRGPRQGNAIVATTHAIGEFETPHGQQRLAEALGGKPGQ